MPGSNAHPRCPPATRPPSVVPTATPRPSGGTATASPTPCAAGVFSDVHPTDYFATPVQYLASHGSISGYADCTFRPYNNTTRAQMVKIVVLGFARPIVTPAAGSYSFADVPPGAPFFDVIKTAAGGSVVSGYSCGGPGEACDGQHRPSFRPNANVTRAQLSKIDVIAAGWALISPGTATFSDVPASNNFYAVIETAACHGVISGYAAHVPPERQCDAGADRQDRLSVDHGHEQLQRGAPLSTSGGGAPGSAPPRLAPIGPRAIRKGDDAVQQSECRPVERAARAVLPGQCDLVAGPPAALIGMIDLAGGVGGDFRVRRDITFPPPAGSAGDQPARHEAGPEPRQPAKLLDNAP